MTSHNTGPRMSRACAALAASLSLVLIGNAVHAADHSEAPATRADPVADIADVYAWHDSERNRLYAVITYDGLVPSSSRSKGTFENDVLYVLHIDNDGDFIADIDVRAFYTRDARGKPLLNVENLPGASGVIRGKAGKSVSDSSGLRVFSGLRDDPFFFDLEGFTTTLQTGTLAFDGSRDSFAGLNVTAIVFEMDLSAALGSGSTVNVWASTARN